MIDETFYINCLFCLPLLSLFAQLLMPNQRVYTYIPSFVMLVSWLICLSILLQQYQQPSAFVFSNWPTGIGIQFMVDRLSIIMLLVFSSIALIICFYSFADQDCKSKHKIFNLGLNILLFGVMGALCTRDLFNLYVWTEVILVGNLCLLTASKKVRAFALFNYSVLSIIGTLLMLMAIALIYGITGSLHYEQIAAATNSPLLLAAISCLFFALGLKAACFPLYFWLPKAYVATSYSATCMLAAISTKAFLIILLRLILLFHNQLSPILIDIMLGCAGATMIFGVLGAAIQQRLRHILSFHIISQIGYILFAFVMATKAAVIAGLYFMIHNILVKSNLLMIAGAIKHRFNTDHLKKLGDMRRDVPMLSALFLISALSLAGLPPLSGFWGKFLLFQAGLEQNMLWIVSIALLVSCFTLYSMIKIWRFGFSELGGSLAPIHRLPILMLLSIITTLFLALLIAFNPDFVLHQLEEIYRELQF